MFKSKIYSFVIVEGVDCFCDAYDKGDNDCLYEVLIPRAKHQLSYIDDDSEAFEDSCYYDIMEHLRYSQLGCHWFKQIFISLSKAIEELVLMLYNSIQDYFDYKSIHNFKTLCFM